MTHWATYDDTMQPDAAEAEREEMKMSRTTIDAGELQALFFKALQDSENPSGETIKVEGLIHKAEFHKERLESTRDTVVGWLALLPDAFCAENGGGWSFLNACQTKDGVQWGEHRDMERLFMLGIGLGVAKWQMLSMREALPGGMPYVVWSSAGFEKKAKA